MSLASALEGQEYIISNINTDDEELNRIIDTAAYTLKLNLQNGYIWDGIKRDRLVWSGDLHQEILLASYLYGDVANIRNSLTFLKEETPPTPARNLTFCNRQALPITWDSAPVASPGCMCRMPMCGRVAS